MSVVRMVLFVPLFFGIWVVGFGLIVRGAFGAGTAAAYWGGVGHVAGTIGHYVWRFIRWTLTEHWQFWLGFAAGMFLMYKFMSP